MEPEIAFRNPSQRAHHVIEGQQRQRHRSSRRVVKRELTPPATQTTLPGKCREQRRTLKIR